MNISKQSLLKVVQTTLMLPVYVFCAVFFGMLFMIETTIVALFRLPKNIKLYCAGLQTNLQLIDRVRDTLNFEGLFVLTVFILAAKLHTPAICGVLAFAALAGLGYVGIRQFERNAGRGNEITRKQKMIANLSSGVLGSVLVLSLAPHVSPGIFLFSILSGGLMLSLTRSAKLPRPLIIAITALVAIPVSYHLSGALGATIAAVGSMYQFQAIGASLEKLANGLNENAVRDAENNFALSYTFLHTAVLAVIITGIATIR